MCTLHQPRRPAADHLADRRFALTLKMAHVERQTQVRGVDPWQYRLECPHRVDQHPRLGLESNQDFRVAAAYSSTSRKPFHQPIQGLLVSKRLAQHARPERHAVAPQFGAQSTAYL